MGPETMYSKVPPETQRSAQWIALWAVACGFAGLLSLLVSDARPGQVTIWLANPLGALALLRLHRQQWPAMLAALLASLWTAKMMYMWAAGPALTGTHSLLSLVIDAGLDVPVHLAEMLLCTVMLSRIAQLARAGENVPVQANTLLRVALIPAAVLAPLGGWAWGITLNGDWYLMTLNWFIGSTIGAVAALPLTLAVYTKRPKLAWAQVSEPLALFMLFGSLAVALWAGTSLPQPFVLMVVPMVWMAALIRYGVLLLPPSSQWWGDALFYLSVLATLLPGLFLAVMSEGQRQASAVLAASESRVRDLYFQTPAMLHSMDAEGRIVRVSKPAVILPSTIRLPGFLTGFFCRIA